MDCLTGEMRVDSREAAMNASIWHYEYSYVRRHGAACPHVRWVGSFENSYGLVAGLIARLLMWVVGLKGHRRDCTSSGRRQRNMASSRSTRSRQVNTAAEPMWRSLTA